MDLLCSTNENSKGNSQFYGDSSINFAALVIASASTRRIGRCKIAEPINGKPLVLRALEPFLNLGLPVVVVTGDHHHIVEDLLKGLPVTLVQDERYRKGPISSIQRGLSMLPEGVDAFFVTHGDIGLVRQVTVERMMEAYRGRKTALCVPTCLGKPGRISLWDSRLMPQFAEWRKQDTLVNFVEELCMVPLLLETADEGILWGLDHPCDVLKLEELAQHRDLPSAMEIDALHQIYSTPERVRRHEERVALTAKLIAKALMEAGEALDLPLLLAAAKLHDLRRTEGLSHPAAGAQSLRELGFPSTAALVEVHMDLPEGQPLEAQVLYLADKVSCDGFYCSLKVRLDRMVAKLSDSQAREACRRRIAKAEAIQKWVGERTGKTLDQIVGLQGASWAPLPHPDSL